MVMLGSTDDNSANQVGSDELRLDHTPVLAYLELRRRVRIVAGTLVLLGFAAAAGWESPDDRPSQITATEPAKADREVVASPDPVFWNDPSVDSNSVQTAR